MTDVEIIKILEHHKKRLCYECPLRDSNSSCSKAICTLALDLINRQNAEIERLKEECFIKSQKRANIFEIVEAFEKGRVKGIKELAECAKQIAAINNAGLILFVERDFDNLVKEKAGAAE